MTESFLREFYAATGLQSCEIRPVNGGDINLTYCLQSEKQRYFLKIHPSGHRKDILEKEAAGLAALQKAGAKGPDVYSVGQAAGLPFLWMEWIEREAPSPLFWEHFGKNLAHLHRVAQPGFGWEQDNYIASLPQVNAFSTGSWGMFYAQCRILPLVRQLAAKGVYTSEQVKKAEALCEKLDDLFPQEPPALLHGDLWSGNFMCGKGGKAWLFDPAVYAGHREMDLGMSLLFGGFDRSFYSAYQEVYPLEKNWEDRILLTQWYPLLVHALLFGGGYAAQSQAVIAKYA